MLVAAKEAGVPRFFYSSSACVYNGDKQTDANVTALKEEDAYPALPEDGYGWEKLFSERMARHYREDYGMATRVARYHNVYGPEGTYDGGREKAPAAMCRKVIAAKLGQARDRDLGRRRADPFVHVHRRLHRGHDQARGERHHRAAEHRQRRVGQHQHAGRHRREDRRHQAEAQLQARRAQGRARPQQRQHADQEADELGSRPSVSRTAWRRPTSGMHEFDDAVLLCFLENQGQPFPEPVAENLEEAEAFLEECMAVVVDSISEVWEYFDEEGIDMEGADQDEIINADEVFEIGDGRYLIAPISGKE